MCVYVCIFIPRVLASFSNCISILYTIYIYSTVQSNNTFGKLQIQIQTGNKLNYIYFLEQNKARVCNKLYVIYILLYI